MVVHRHQHDVLNAGLRSVVSVSRSQARASE